MKKILSFLAGALLTLGLAQAQVSNNYWKLQGTTLSPLSSGWTVSGVSGGSSTSTFGFITATTTTATSTFAGDVYITGNLRVTGNFFAPVAISSASDINPSSNSIYSLGTSALKWLNVYANHLYISGTSTLATTTITGDLTLNGTFINRVVGYSSSASTTINVNTTDIATTTITATTTFVNPTGVAVDGKMFEIRAKATTTHGIFFGTNFASSTDLNNVSQIASGTTRWLFEYRQDVGKWELVGLLKNYIN